MNCTTSISPRLRRAQLAAAALGAVLVGCCGQVQAQNDNAKTPVAVTLVAVTVSAEVVGKTPEVIGYNMGDDFPGSNVSSWLRYSGMNGARQWWPQDAWPAAPARWQGADDLAHFQSERARLRANPAGAMDWNAYEKNLARLFKTPPGTLGAVFALSELRKMDASVLAVLSRSTSLHPFDKADGAPDWFGRWTYWRGVYLNAFYLARVYDVERFQLFNEPDHSAHKDLQQTDFLRRLQLGSDAVQAALSDVNRLYGKSLRPQISAPVTAGLLVFSPRSGRKDTRDAKTGWGELVMRHLHDDFPGKSADNLGLFQNYAFQSYGRNPDSIAEGLPKLRALIEAANGGAALPIIVSEMNVSTAMDFSRKPETLDSPGYYDAFGAIAAAYLNAGIDEIYVFRLTQTANLGNGQVKKNGTHVIDNADPRRDITASTRGAEAVRLLMRGFAGARLRYASPTIGAADLYAAAAQNQSDGARTLMIANTGEARDVRLNLAAWRLPAGALTTVETVSETHHGDVGAVFSLAPSPLALPLEAHSISLLTIRPTLSGAPAAISPAQISGGVLRFARPAALRTPLRNRRALLALKIAATGKPLRVRVYGGEKPTPQSELLGQIVVSGNAEKIVNVTRFVTTAKRNLAFYLVPDDATTDANAFRLESAQLRFYDALSAKK